MAAAASLLAPASAPGAMRGDFDADGYADLAVAAPEDSVSGVHAAGAVNVIYGSARGLHAAGDQEWTQDAAGVPGGAGEGDRFGGALAAGDFDGDGDADLAVGSPGERISATAGGVPTNRMLEGTVTVLYGRRGGLSAHGAQRWSQDTPGIQGRAESGDTFGQALAAGDFDGDGRDDLAVGVPGDRVRGHRGAGAVNVLYGSSHGLTTRDRLFTLDTPGIKGRAAGGFDFGYALAAGDLSSNGRDDLAVGIPGAHIAGAARTGAVTVLYGRAGGLGRDDQFWSQEALGIAGTPERGDAFGSALAIGDFDGDAAGDLAVGVPLEDAASARAAGAVNVLYGSGAGLRAAGNQLWTRASPGIKDRAVTGDRFGSALASGDVDADERDELAIGVPFDDVAEQADAGAVSLLAGSRTGLRSAGDRELTQDTRLDTGDAFGTALALADFDGDGTADLAAGARHDSVQGHTGAGAVRAFYGSREGLRISGEQLWTRGTRGILGAVGEGAFGVALAP